MDIVLAVFAIVLLLLWVIGSFAPILPGPPISLLGLLMIEMSKYDTFGTGFWIVLLLLTALSVALDYIIPVWWTKKFGGSKAGTWWATIGLVVWLFAWPVWIIFWPFVWAIIGELLYQRTTTEAIRSGIWSLVWFVLGTGIKLALTGIMLWYGVMAILSY